MKQAKSNLSRPARNRSRRGSILILVVALLVLLALIGTAYIATTRSDRLTSQIHTDNSQADLLVEGMIQNAKSTLSNALFDRTSGTANPYRNRAGLTSYSAGDMPDFLSLNSTDTFQRSSTPWLSPRFPIVPDLTLVGGGSAANEPYWYAIGTPLIANTFESPYLPAGFSNVNWTQRISTASNRLIPGWTSPITLPDGTVVQYPAFLVQNTVPGEPSSQVVVAADADGDGIADSGLQRIGDYNGLTWYAGFRIIDNSAAININTAYTYWSEFGRVNSGAVAVANGTDIRLNYSGLTGFDPVTAMFQANIGLGELLRTWPNPTSTQTTTGGLFATAPTLPTRDPSEFRRLSWWRFGIDTNTPRNWRMDNGSYDIPFGLPLPDGTVPNSPFGGALTDRTRPLSDSISGSDWVKRPDFIYFSLAHANDTLLANRFDSPGLTQHLTAGNLQAAYRARKFSLSDGGSLAYRFVIPNPESGLSFAERVFEESVYGLDADNNPSTPPVPAIAAPFAGTSQKQYGASNADRYAWYNYNFNWAAENTGNVAPFGNPDPSTFLSRRSMFVVTNAQSNYTSPKAVGTSTTQLPNETSTPANLPPQTRFMPSYTLAPTGQPVLVKANARTALFPELWRAYWNVMANPGGETAYGPDVVDNPPAGDPPLPYVGPRHTDDLYRGSKFPNPAATGYDYGTLPATPVPVAQDPIAFEPNPFEDHFQRMFRSPIRDNRVITTGAAAVNAARLTSEGTMSLRSALAAINTTSMRQPESRGATLAASSAITGANADNILGSITQVIYLRGKVNNIDEDWAVRIFGATVQPYITEVYVSTDNSVAGQVESGGPAPNPVGYAAIELFNPYPVPIVLDATWQIQVMDRSTAAATPIKTLNPLFTFSGQVVPAGGYLIIETMDTGTANPATENLSVYRPKSSGLPPIGVIPNRANYVVVSDVPLFDSTNPAIAGGVLNREMVLTRRFQTSTNAALMPVDSFDFTGLTVPMTPPPTGFDPDYVVSVWHYVRQNFDGALRGRWGFVYPGRYDGRLAERRHQGTQAANWNPSAVPVTPDPFAVTAPTPPMTLGATDLSPTSTLNIDNTQASYPRVFPIQVLNVDQPGAFPARAITATSDANRFPFGSYARNGDILHTMFIGAYTVQRFADFNAGNNIFIELNSLPMDASFAEDTDLADDPQPGDNEFYAREQIGRFSRVYDPNASGVDDLQPNNPALDQYSGYQIDPTEPRFRPWRYRWALSLFDYVTVQSGTNDLFPDISRDAYTVHSTSGGTALPPRTVSQYSIGGIASDPGSITGTPATTNSSSEDASPVEGRININTAPWRVLSQIPWVPRGSDFNNNGLEDNEEIAKAIVQFRDGVSYGLPASAAPLVGPFQNIFEIYRVPQVFQIQAEWLRLRDPSIRDGDFAPWNTATAGPYSVPATQPSIHGPSDGVRLDYEEQNLIAMRVSNLISTRSDSFTVYIVVEGWRNVGTPTPERVIQKRAAFIADRSTVQPGNPAVRASFIPTE